MKAAWYEHIGPAAEVIRVGEMDKPEPAAGEVLVRVHASGVNPSDVKARAGTRGGRSGMAFARVIPHSDGAGIIEAVGAGVDTARIGERVWLWNGQWQRPFGTAAEYIALPAVQAASLPPGVSFEVGAALGIPAMTAAHCVLGDGPVAGQAVLISSGSGNVGRLMVQMARQSGARVIATARGDAERARVEAAGAHTTVDFTAPQLAQDILAANGGKLIDRIIEVEFGVNVETLAEVIKPRGHLVTYGSAIKQRPELPFYPLMFKGVKLEFVVVYLLNAGERQAAVAQINDLLARQALEVPIHARFPLEQCAAAHQCVEKPGRAGAVIVQVA